MSFELLYYIFMSCIALFFCFVKLKNNVVYFFLFITVSIIYSVITRYSGFDTDIKTYAMSMEYSSLSIYYLKEPVFWFLSRFVYSLINSKELTFVIFDFLSFLFLFFAAKQMKLPQYFPFVYLLFFTSLMGFNNVYRQYLSSILFLFSFSLLFVDSSIIKRVSFFVLSVLTHNVSALLFPLYFLFYKHRISFFYFVLSSLLIILLMPLAVSTKSNSETGTVSIILYLLVIMFLFFLYLSVNKFYVYGVYKKFYYFFCYSLLLLAGASIFMGGGQSKRIGMYLLVLLIVPVVMVIEHKAKPLILSRIIFVVIAIVPTFVFSSSFNMLLSSSR